MSEPMHDDITLEWIEVEKRKDLVAQLWQYSLSLEDYVVRLRNQINELAENQHRKIPFPDPASDFAMRFDDHPAYSEFSEVLMDEEPNWKIPD